MQRLYIDLCHSLTLRDRIHRQQLCFLLLVLTIAACFNAPAHGAGMILFDADSDYDYDSQLEIHLSRDDGRAHRRIQPRYPMHSASLHPDGNSIVYSRTDKPELRTIGIDGKKDRLLATLASTTEKVAWSPDGRYVAYEELTSTSSIALALGLSYYDLRTKKHIRGVPITQKFLGGVLNNGITNISWSPDRSTLAVTVTDLIFAGGGFSESNATYVVNAGRGTAKKLVDAVHFGFMDNRRILAKRQDLSLGYIHVNLPDQFFQLASIGNGFDAAVAIDGGKSAIVRYRYFFDGEFDINDTNLTSITGKSQAKRVKFDLLEIDLTTLAGKFVTPRNAAFLPNQVRFSALKWHRRAPKRAFRTDTCWGWVVTLKGTNRRDRINGTPGADVITGLGGNDIIRAGAGNDVVCGGAGHDELRGQTGNDVLFGDMPVNVVHQSDTLPRGNDRLFGESGIDTLFGQNGKDRLLGGDDGDFMSGGPGNDIINGQRGEGDYGDGNQDNDVCRNLKTTVNCER